MIIFRIVLALIVLGLLIFIHEFGHFIVGKSLGIGVIEFAIGFGPKLFSWERKGIIYSVRLLPIGGFTQFEGEDENSESPTAMNNQPVWKRILTVVAGPVFNIVFAFICTIILLSTYGEMNTKIMEVAPNSPASEYGLQVGDRISEVNGRNTVFSMEALTELYKAKNKGGSVNLVVNRDGNSNEISMNFNEQGKVGIALGEVEKYNLLESISKSARWTYMIFYDTLTSLGGLFTGSYKVQDMGGAVAIVDTLGTAIKVGFYPLMQITVIISFSLGIMNLLPIPALDGEDWCF